MKGAAEKTYLGYLLFPLSLPPENFIVIAMVIDPKISGSHRAYLDSGLGDGCTNWRPSWMSHLCFEWFFVFFFCLFVVVLFCFWYSENLHYSRRGNS